MSDVRLIKLGQWFDAMVEVEARAAEGGDDIPDSIDVLGIAHRIERIRARTPGDLAVKARVVDYLLEHAHVGVAPMVESFLRDLRRLGVLPPASGQAMPPARSNKVVRLAVPDRVLQLAA